MKHTFAQRPLDAPTPPAWRRLRRLDRAFILYGLVVAALVVACYLCSLLGLLPYELGSMDLAHMNEGPTARHLFGTDNMGRDLLTRIIAGTQAFFLPGLLAIAIALVGGTAAGVLGGYYGGAADKAASYVLNVIDSIPKFVLLLLIIAIFKPDIYFIMVVVGVTNIPTVAAFIKGKILFLKGRDFIEAAVALGLSNSRIIFKHILYHHCLPLLVIQATIGMGEAILVEASLSYLGFGVQEPLPSWGNLVAAGNNYVLQGVFYYSAIPALVIMFGILGFYLLGDGLSNLFEEEART